MKKSVVFLLVVVALRLAWMPLSHPKPVHAQTNVVRTPDCVIPFRFSSTGNNGTLAAPGSTPAYNNGFTACTIWTLTYQVTGYSVVSIEFDGAPDSNGAAGSFSTWTNLFSGSLPSTSTTYTQISGYGFAPWMQVTVNTATGSGQIVGTLNGWRNQVGDASLPASGPALPAKADAIVFSYETLASGGITTSMTATTSTQVIAGTISQNIYVTSCTVSNAHATQGTDVVLQDGSNGTVIWNFPAAAVYGGTAHSFGNSPLKVPTQGNGLFAANVTAGASTKIFCNGFKSANSY